MPNKYFFLKKIKTQTKEVHLPCDFLFQSHVYVLIVHNIFSCKNNKYQPLLPFVANISLDSILKANTKWFCNGNQCDIILISLILNLKQWNLSWCQIHHLGQNVAGRSQISNCSSVCPLWTGGRRQNLAFQLHWLLTSPEHLIPPGEGNSPAVGSCGPWRVIG